AKGARSASAVTVTDSFSAAGCSATETLVTTLAETLTTRDPDIPGAVASIRYSPGARPEKWQTACWSATACCEPPGPLMEIAAPGTRAFVPSAPAVTIVASTMPPVPSAADRWAVMVRQAHDSATARATLE